MLSAPAAAEPEPFDYGPPPDWEEYKRLGETSVRAALPDQEKWAIEWPNGTIPFDWDHKGHFKGYMTCGIMRATAPVIGRYPVTNFIVVIDRGVVKKVDIAPRAMNDIRNETCNQGVVKGLLPPATLMQPSSVTSARMADGASSNLTIERLGLTIRAMPAGAYVVSVAQSGAGQRIGLAPGTVITVVNGIPLAGLSDAMAKVLSSAAGTLSLETATGDKLTLNGSTP